MSSSYELSPKNFAGDLLALVAGLLYGGYLIFVERGADASFSRCRCCCLSTLFAIPPLLVISWACGERIWPHDWTPLLIFALSSQVLGQGLLVYSIGTLPPLVVGLALLTQPAISALIGWFAYRERLCARRLHRRASPSPPRWCWSGLPERGLRTPRRRSPVERDGRRRARSRSCAAASPSPSARMRCSTAGPRKAVDSAAGQLGIDPVKARLAMPKGQAAMIDLYIQEVDRALEAWFTPERLAALKIRDKIRALVWRRLEIMGAGARGGAPRARHSRHAAERAAGAAHLAGGPPTSCGGSPATPAPTSTIIPSG